MSASAPARPPRAPAASTASGRRRRSEIARALLWAALLFALHFGLTTRFIAFPFWYHWDEEGKAAQIVSGSRDLNHPLLLVNTASAIRKAWSPDARRLQDVTVLGRVASAAFVAGAIAAMSLAAWIVAGPLAGLMAGILVGLDPGLFDAAHFFKEDSALLVGWAALIASVAVYCRRPGAATVLLTGAAAALCASGKYIGILPAILAALFVARWGSAERWTPLAFVAAFVAVCAVVNAQLLLAPQTAMESIAAEVERQLRVETVVDRPWVLWARVLGLGGIAAMAIALVRLRSVTGPGPRPQWFALTTLVAYFVCLCFVVRMAHRYMLPIYLVSWWFAGIGAAWLLVRSARHRFALALACVLVAALVAMRAEAAWSGWKGFSGQDTRVALARHLDRLARPGDQVMLDFTVNLPGAYAKQREVDGWMPSTRMLQVTTWNSARGADMYEAILREGFTLVAIRPDHARRYSLRSHSAEFGLYRDREWRRPFYDRLLREGRVEAVVDGVEGSFVSPHLVLIRIADPR